MTSKEAPTMMEGTLSSKNQATIPKPVREYLHLKPGDRFRFFFQPDGWL
jgi:antitoxin PrlF